MVRAVHVGGRLGDSGAGDVQGVLQVGDVGGANSGRGLGGGVELQQSEELRLRLRG